jgi:hypothetical protein
VIFPQPLLIFFVLFIPAFLLYKKKHDYLVIWISIITIIDIFNSQKYMNLTAFKMTGIIVIPYLFKNYKQLISSNAVKVCLLHILYLAILGLILGHIIPWEDATGLKSGRDIPQWRSIVHMGSIILEISATFYLALQFIEIKKIYLSLKAIMFGALASIVASVIELFFHFDFYHFFTAKKEVFIKNRMKGLNYEPRGFAQTSSYLIILSTYFLNNSPYIYGAFILASLSAYVYLTMSATGTIVLISGLIIPIAYLLIHEKFTKKLQQILFILVFTVFGLIIYSFLYPNDKSTSIKDHLEERSYILTKNDLSSKLEVFDSAAVIFYQKNPKYLFFGTGPGLISTPIGRKYLHEKDRNTWNKGFIALPHMGIILLISNGGIVGLTLWLIMISVCVKGFRKKAFQLNNKDYKLLFFIFINLVLIYLIQIRYLYYIGLAIGFSSTFKNNEKLIQS